jgi:predicted transcriptional regulator YheO
MLCINFNGSKYVNLAKQILKMTGMENASIENEQLNSPQSLIENISSSISEATDNAVKLSLENSYVPVDRLNQEEKIDIVRDLEAKGVFMLKGAVSEVAEKMGVSEATLYRYIRIVSNEKKNI